MRLLQILVLFFPLVEIFSQSSPLPPELILRPWRTGGEISGFARMDSGEKTGYGGILQVPFFLGKEEGFRISILGSDRDSLGKRSSEFGLGYRSPRFILFGFQIQLGGSPEKSPGIHASFGLHRAFGSLDFLFRKKMDEEIFGVLLRSGHESGIQITVSLETIRRNDGTEKEERISFGFVWSLERISGDVKIGETGEEPSGHIVLGISPFYKTLYSEKQEPPPKPKTEKPKKKLPSLSADELLSYGFSLSESLSISSASKEEEKIFLERISSLSEEKRKKIRRLILKKERSGL
ncbi:hypothetical protein [Leptospira wolffii]|uniref:hypothetical protein n=1 Tax=Leptospira wolffii TaxID=409998 RepID=UPI00031936A1|nr:hypothetical protein [Leptospira wolffii]EPG67469.1 hypothetical protein LEP1GSC061_0884 [Leptospira wolffii serovar Khorat str. Khorat-H2]